ENEEDYVAAARLYEKSLALCRLEPRNLQYLLTAYDHAKDYEGVIRTATRYIERRPALAWAYVKRASAEYKLNRLEDSLRDYEKAAALGDIYGLKGVAWYYANGKGVKVDLPRAIELYGIAAARGDAQ